MFSVLCGLSSLTSNGILAVLDVKVFSFERIKSSFISPTYVSFESFTDILFIIGVSFTFTIFPFSIP